MVFILHSTRFLFYNYTVSFIYTVDLYLFYPQPTLVNDLTFFATSVRLLPSLRNSVGNILNLRFVTRLYNQGGNLYRKRESTCSEGTTTTLVHVATGKQTPLLRSPLLPPKDDIG